ncbi:hypothetical protein D9619_003326 [Psilocybe cf. subviscida]|uniref:Copper acquisition factor BIM1-like domain-containing protein n=1 Tax=Psilocybe cf. subviscida TaxID=2480587 RepID=A0A8H5ETE6_9AGAR|nr:hypothetical protein D9619_003326 [Psilocybe cf. subviscida]
MRFTALAVLPCLFGAASAHFRLQYPLPRGNFVADKEPEFCGGYPEVTTNRTVFPLSNGFFTIKSGHPDFTLGAIISTVTNPNSFDNFSVNGVNQIVAPYGKEPNAGTFCVPLNISAAGIEGAKDGANVTIQIVFAGGDGNLYQCADLTLSANLTSVPDQTCENTTSTTPHGSGSGGHDASPSATAPGSTQTGGALGVSHGTSAATAVLLAVAGIAAAL